MKQFTKITFLLAGEEITKYFEGKPKYGQIIQTIGILPITDMQTIKGNFQADYIKSKTSLSGYTSY